MQTHGDHVAVAEVAKHLKPVSRFLAMALYRVGSVFQAFAGIPAAPVEVAA